MRRYSSPGHYVLFSGLFLLIAASCGHQITKDAVGSASIETSSGGTSSSPDAGGAGGGPQSSSNNGPEFQRIVQPAPSDNGNPGTGECPAKSMPKDIYSPGYASDATRDKQVNDLLSSMNLAAKIKQLYGIIKSNGYDDIERSEDAETSAGTILGLRYRDAGRGVNLAAGQDNRPRVDDYATAFPVSSIRAASWDLDLEMRVGEAIGDETMASKNNMLLAPCMNNIRHPYWGRTQETYSEDVYHTGRMATALTTGLQKHVMACAKHYAANNIESGRDNQNAEMDEQTLREIYAAHFEMVVRDGGVACVMASYNLINGKKSTQNKHLLTEILRDAMGYKGLVISDWWAMPGAQKEPDTSTAQQQALEALTAGLDIEVPWALNYNQLGSLVSGGQLTETDINKAAKRVLEQKFRFNTVFTDSPWGLGTPVTKLENGSIANNEGHLDLAEEAEIKSAVLLKNGTGDSKVLPILDSNTVSKDVKSIAVVGLDMEVTISGETQPPVTGSTMHYATDVNIGDRGSSRVNADPAKSIGPFAGIKEIAGKHGVNVTSGNSVDAAKDADLAVVIVGLSAGDEGEEYAVKEKGDRRSLDVPGDQNKLVDDVLSLNKPTVIIIESGSIVNLPWLSHRNKNQATVWAGYGGQRGGRAFAKLIFAEDGANFAGKVPLAWPKQEDLTEFRAAEGMTTHMDYFHGYRYYDNEGKSKNLVFPFGHGMSYTTFEYSNLSLPCDAIDKKGVIYITADVKNTGSVKGDEVMMLFVKGPPKPADIKGKRPVKELKGFQRVSLDSSGNKSSARVTFTLPIDSLRHWEGDANGKWVIDEGEYTVLVGPNASEDALKLQGKFRVHG